MVSVVKNKITAFVSENYDLFTLASIDIATSLSDIDLLAKAITSLLILLIAVRRLLNNSQKTKDVEKIKKELRKEVKKEFGISEDIK